jgi:ABC-type nickel/cobalt efflux system permease component RcnA
MIVVLGLWLIARKVFRIGNQHHHEPAMLSMQSLARQHLGQPAHALAAGGPALTNFSVAATGVDAYGRAPGHAHYGHNHGDDDHGHAHVVMPGQTGGGWREQLGVVLAVGLRPCSGALIVLAFALSQGLLAAGIVAVLLMGLGTAITTGTLAALAVGAKGLARKVAGADNPVTSALVWWVELLAAVAVLGFGVILLLASL